MSRHVLFNKHEDDEQWRRSKTGDGNRVVPGHVRAAIEADK